MRIGIDISQVAYEGTGVARYIKELIPRVITQAPEHDFILFAGSLRQQHIIKKFVASVCSSAYNVKVKIVPIPPSVLDFLWNTMHIVPIQWFTGPIDVFWSSDWTQPPVGRAIGITTIHDVSFLHYPESFHKRIVAVQRRRLLRAIQECSSFLCDSQATKDDVADYIGINRRKLIVVYPGFSKIL